LSDPLHATLMAFREDGAWRGLLLRGPSGAGKSDLALRLMGRGWRLVADDRVLVWSSGGAAWGRAPDVLWGLLEIRGVGVLSVPVLRLAEIVAVADCVKPAAELDRTPLPETTDMAGVRLPLRRISPLESAAPDKLAAFCGARRV